MKKGQGYQYSLNIGKRTRLSLYIEKVKAINVCTLNRTRLLMFMIIEKRTRLSMFMIIEKRTRLSMFIIIEKRTRLSMFIEH